MSWATFALAVDRRGQSYPRSPMTTQLSAVPSVSGRLAASVPSGGNSRSRREKTQALSPSGSIPKVEVFDAPEASFIFRRAGTREASTTSCLEDAFRESPHLRIQSACFPTMRDGLATAPYERHIRMARGTEWTATEVMQVLDRVRAGASGGLGKKSKPQHRAIWHRWKADTRPSCGVRWLSLHR